MSMLAGGSDIKVFLLKCWLCDKFRVFFTSFLVGVVLLNALFVPLVE